MAQTLKDTLARYGLQLLSSLECWKVFEKADGEFAFYWFPKDGLWRCDGESGHVKEPGDAITLALNHFRIFQDKHRPSPKRVAPPPRNVKTNFPGGKAKITQEGQRCRHCKTPVIRREHPPEFVPDPAKAFWFEWWFYCPKCRAVYLIDEAKRFHEAAQQDRHLEAISRGR